MTTETVHHTPPCTVRHPHPVVLALAAALACGDRGTEPPTPLPPEPPRPTTVAVSPATARLTALGATVQLGARVLDQRGQVMPGAEAAWSSADTTVATVDGSGLVTAAGNGSANVTATSGPASGSAAVTVAQDAAAVAVMPAADTLLPGDTLRLSARAVDGNGHAVTVAEFAWSSSDVSVASVDETGLVLGVAPGEAAIRAVSGTVQGLADITVENPDRAALVALYQAAGGPNWARSGGWLTDAPIGQWYGVTTDRMGAVERLHLSANGLTGAIPPELGNLGSLESLHLGANRLTGPVPPELGNLVSLERLTLGNNRLTGAIPPELGNLASLKSLNLAGSGLTGAIPPELGSLASLEDLNLGSNRLTGTIPPELGNLGSLKSLSMAFSGLTGAIPSELGNLTRLEFLNLADNGIGVGNDGLTGPIPPELGNLANLRILWLNNNSLSGPIPPELGGLASLELLSLYFNDLTGPIPPELGGLASLEILWLQGNGLTGPIPPELGGLASLEVLSLYFNDLTGPIPPKLGNLASLETLRLHANMLTGPIPPELGNLTGLDTLRLGNNMLTGTIPSELGNLTGLETLRLHANMLAGPIPPELGNLASLETLWLHDNDLSGAVPAEFGAMSRLRQLYLGGNPSLDGTLPSRLTALTRLDELLAGDTGLCAPADSDFQAWLEGVYRVRIARCAIREQPAAYLTQTVQSREFPVPLVAGERALLRVFPTALKETSEGIPLVRARFYRDGVETHEVDIPGKSTPIPTEVDEGDLAKSVYVEIPGSVVQDGLEMVVEIDPDSTLDPTLGVTKRIPEEGRLALEVKDMPPLDLTLIPFIWSHTQDSAIVDLIEEMVDEQEDHEMFGELHLLPVGEVHVTAHEPVVSSTNNVIGLLHQTIAIRVMEGGTGHYQGMMSPPVTGARGVAFAPGRSSVSVPNAGTIAHELGHNFNLLHAPCGDPAALDPFYPQSDGSIGAWGFDFRDGGRLVPPSTPDLMSYCRRNQWISDYGFTSALRFRGTDADSVALPHRGSSQSLLLWGGIDANGTPFLEPAFVIDAPPALPDSKGEYRLVGRTSDGAELFSLSFGMPAVLDGDGSSGFAFVLPAQPSWQVGLASITLSGPDGSVTLDGDSSAPMTILRDPRTGRVRGIIRGLPPTAPAEADASAWISPGGSVAMLFSRGIPDMEAWR